MVALSLVDVWLPRICSRSAPRRDGGCAVALSRRRSRFVELRAGGTPYRIRTDDLRLERAVSWATRRTGLRRLGAGRRRAGAAGANYTAAAAELRRAAD